MNPDILEPAFPAHSRPKNFADAAPSGMSIRDYFAAKAMAAYIGYITARGSAMRHCKMEVAEESYAIADAMLAERAKATE